MSGEVPGANPDQIPKSEVSTSRPRGTLSEAGLIAFVKLAKRKRIKSLRDLLPYLESKFDSLGIPNGARDEIRDAAQELKDRENPRYLTISHARIVINGKECKVLVATGHSGSTGFAPVPSLVASEIVAAANIHPKREIKLTDINHALEHQPGLSIPQVIAITNENLAVLGDLFGYRRQVVPERWYYQLRAGHGFRRPTPPEWGNGSIPGTRRYNIRGL